MSTTRWALYRMIYIKGGCDEELITIADSQKYKTKAAAERAGTMEANQLSDAMKRTYGSRPDADDIIRIGNIIVDARLVQAANFSISPTMAICDNDDPSDDDDSTEGSDTE